MNDYIEYEFTLKDGSKRYEMIDLRERIMPQVHSASKMHGADWRAARSVVTQTAKDFADAIKPLADVPVRFFIFDEEEDCGNGETGDIRECKEWEFDKHEGTISYSRHTVFENGVSQICLTKI